MAIEDEIAGTSTTLTGPGQEAEVPVLESAAPSEEQAALEAHLNIGENGLYEGMGELEQAGAEAGAGVEETPPESETPEAPSPFIGDLMEEDVLSALQQARDLPQIRQQIENAVMGRLGPLAKDLKHLKTEGLKEFNFNPDESEAVKKLIELDSGIGTAVADVLRELKVQTLGVEDAIAPILDDRFASTRAELWDERQDELLSHFVPDAFEIGPTEEFTKFLQTRPTAEQEVLLNWGQEGAAAGQKNAKVAVSVFQAFKTQQDAEAEKVAAAAAAAKAKEAGLRKAAEDNKGGNGAAAPSALSEQEALDQRLKEGGGAPWLFQ